MSHPIRSEEVQASVERQALVLGQSCTAGKMWVEFTFKDGKWRVGNVTVTAYPLKHSAEIENDSIPHPGPGRV